MKNNANGIRKIGNRMRKELQRKGKITNEPSMWSEEDLNFLSERKLEIKA